MILAGFLSQIILSIVRKNPGAVPPNGLWKSTDGEIWGANQGYIWGKD